MYICNLDNTRHNGSHIILHLYLDRNFISVFLLISLIWDEISKYLFCEKINFNLLISRKNLIQNLYNIQRYSFPFFLSFFLSFFLIHNQTRIEILVHKSS